MLSSEQRHLLEIALGDKTQAAAIADAVDNAENVVAAAVADIADPGTATAEDVANKVNELMASMRTAGLLAS